MPVTVSNVTPRGVIDFCMSHGVSSDVLLARAGIAPDQMAPGSRVAVEQAFALWEEAQRATGVAHIAEHVTRVLPLGAYRIADYLLMTGATPRDSLVKFIRSFPLVNGAFQLNLASSRTGARLEICSRYDPEGPARFYVEFIFSMIFARLRLAAGVDWRPKEMVFTHASPTGMDNYHPTFDCPARFNESVNQMVLEKDFEDMPLPHGDALLSEMLDHYAQSLLKQSATNDFLSEVRKVLSDGFSRGDVRLETTARKLALSGRSLQRELNGRGTSYREELDRIRLDLALDLLTRAEVRDISNVLQFSDVSSFYRAYRRWTGKTPAEYLDAKSH
jgi:AraC-like DNA-binding protein